MVRRAGAPGPVIDTWLWLAVWGLALYGVLRLASRGIDQTHEWLLALMAPARLHDRLACRCDGEEMLLRGVDDNGDPIEVYVQTCDVCGALINTVEADMAEHYQSAHLS